MKALLVFLISFNLWSDDLKKFQKIFQSANKIEKIEIPDPISEKPTNTELILIKENKKNLGYAREIKTDTGCNSGCLPVIFTLYYDSKKNFIDLTSKPGLTKKNHARFTSQDYLTLKGILFRNPENFSKITHPYEMVDMVSGATKKEYVPDVVEKAAYTSLRVNTYNQQTLKFLSSFKP